MMDLWGLPQETSGASQPAFGIYPHGAAQPVGGDVAKCVGVRVAHLSVWNVQKQATAVVHSGTWSATTGHSMDVYWQGFDLTYRVAPPLADRDASQLADCDALQLAAPKVGLLVGNMHIPVGRASAPTKATRRRIVEHALQHLTRLEVDAWRGRANFPVIRVLVGDCNLNKEAAVRTAMLAR